MRPEPECDEGEEGAMPSGQLTLAQTDGFRFDGLNTPYRTYN